MINLKIFTLIDHSPPTLRGTLVSFLKFLPEKLVWNDIRLPLPSPNREIQKQNQN